MNVLAGIGFGVAALAGMVLVAIGLSQESGRDGGRLMGTVMFSLPFLGGLLVACGVALARGAFDGTGLARSTQVPLVLLGMLAAVVVNVLCAAGRYEPASQIPWAVWPLRGWLFAVWPPLLLAGTAWALWPARAPAAPDAVRIAVLLVPAVVSLGVCVLLLVQWAQSGVARQQARVEEQQADDRRRDDAMRGKVREADPVRDLVLILPHTSRFEQPDIRALALGKLAAHPDLSGALAQLLRGGFRDVAFIYLDSNEPPDAVALAPAVRDGLNGMAAQLHDQVRDTHTLRPDDCEHDVRRMLSVAERFAPLGVDARPAFVALRAGLVQPRERPMVLNALRLVDDWLQQHPPASAPAR